jgi:hypothetical protein
MPEDVGFALPAGVRGSVPSALGMSGSAEMSTFGNDWREPDRESPEEFDMRVAFVIRPVSAHLFSSSSPARFVPVPEGLVRAHPRR